MDSYLGCSLDLPWDAAILTTISPKPDFSRLAKHTLPYIAPTMEGPNFTRDLMKVFEMCNQSVPDAGPSAWELRRIVERKIGRAQKVLGSFEGVTEERMRVRVGKEELGIGKALVGIRVEYLRREVGILFASFVVALGSCSYLLRSDHLEELITNGIRRHRVVASY
jgi:hypothetical protein